MEDVLLKYDSWLGAGRMESGVMELLSGGRLGLWNEEMKKLVKTTFVATTAMRQPAGCLYFHTVLTGVRIFGFGVYFFSFLDLKSAGLLFIRAYRI